MTVDDDNSIYVGGLPYNATEDSIRRVFNLYGSVVAVKIINDRDIGGKCYGFVTFTNPRSAIDAISDMNGRTIDGRVVRVNEVRTRRGRTNFNRGHTHRDNDRDMDWDRDRERDRDFDHDRERYHDRNSNRSQDHDRDREEDYERSHDHDRTRDHFLNRDEDWKQEHDEKEWNRNRDHDWVRDSDIDWGRGRDDRISDYDRKDRDKDEPSKSRIGFDYDRKDRDKDEPSKSRIGSHLIDRGTRELSSNSSDDYYDQVKEQVEISIQKREELQKEISQIEKALEDKQQLVSDLQKKSLKLEDALAAAKKIASQRGMQLTKFHRCIQQVKDYSERLKSSELELQSLVDVVMVEAGDAEDVDRDGMLYSNGKA